MRKIKVTIFVLIWALLIMVGIGYIIVSLNGDGHLGKFSFGVSNTIMLKEENYSIQGVKNLDVSVSHDAIELMATDGKDFHVTQYGSEKAPDDALYNLRRDGDRLVVSVNNHTNIHIGLNFSKEKLVIEVPREWIGSVKMETSSGSIKILDEFLLENLYANTSSGSIKIEKQLNVTNLKMSSSSGSIKIEDNITAMEGFESKSRSGSQSVGGVLTAKNALFQTSSGGIYIQNKINCDGKLSLSSSSGSITIEGENNADSFNVKSSSGGIRLGKMQVKTFDIGCTSGSIRVDEISGGGSLETTSGGITANLLNPVGNVTAISTSGNVNLTVPSEMSFQFEADTTSGNIKTNFEIMYRSNRGNSAIATVGSNPTVKIKAEATSGNIKVDRNVEP
ncbi:MAG: DUF4097 family beta strand repeat-containing protein [Bacillota bacterium]|nr:DUF4097 family beta strand repeat-containing protein [Bacillota bacterium]